MTATSAHTAAEAAPGPRVDRIASAAVQDTLERISSADLLAAGAVNMIGLEAIRRKVGERWPRKAPAVWEHVEREIERTLGPTSVFVRIDDITYLIAMPGEQGFAAQATCLTILQDVLKFFLGEMRWGDVSLRQVTQIQGGSVISAEVDPTSVRQRPAAAPTPAEQAAEAVSGPLADHA